MNEEGKTRVDNAIVGEVVRVIEIEDNTSFYLISVEKVIDIGDFFVEEGVFNIFEDLNLTPCGWWCIKDDGVVVSSIVPYSLLVDVNNELTTERGYSVFLTPTISNTDIDDVTAKEFSTCHMDGFVFLFIDEITFGKVVLILTKSESKHIFITRDEGYLFAFEGDFSKDVPRLGGKLNKRRVFFEVGVF